MILALDGEVPPPMQHSKGAPCSNGSTTDDHSSLPINSCIPLPGDEPTTAAYTRVADALRHQPSFERGQLAYLMPVAYRWGYEARVDEENNGWPEPSVFCAGDTIKAIDQRACRAQCDKAARLPRLGDHHGGPVAWDDAELQAAA